MAPLPANSTPVLFVDYTFNGEGHTMAFRGSVNATAAELAAVAQSFLDEAESLLADGWTVTGTRFRAQGTDFTVPGPTLGPLTPGGGPLNPVNNPRYASFIGRGNLDGRRARIFVYGLTFPMQEDYRFGPTENGVLNSMRNVLQAASVAGTLTTVGGSPVTWYEYINAGFNSYWERQQRT